MEKTGVAGLLLRLESVSESCNGRHARRQALMVQSNRQFPVLPQHRAPIYSPLALPPSSRSNPTIIQPDDKFEALVEEIVERQPFSSPDPLSRGWIFEPWPRLQMVSLSPISAPSQPLASRMTSTADILSGDPSSNDGRNTPLSVIGHGL